MFKLIVLFIFLIGSITFAGPSCLDKAKQCDPDMLCTFKSEYYAKLVGYIAYTMNDVRTSKQKRGVDGIYFDGSLRQESIDEAIKANPNQTKSEQLQDAGQRFQRKVAKLIQSTFEEPTCRHGGKFQKDLAPAEGYQGMSTGEKCEIKVEYYNSQYDPVPFINNGTACLEFYQRDLAHEKIHKKRCELAIAKGKQAERYEIDNIIAEEADAYRHSVSVNEAQMRFLNLKCSSNLKDPKALKRLMNTVNNLLKPYL